ncbi:hypothetical protein [Nocardiopsis ansamitocini]|uniref:hypothetical protein n=1 Tax=Nocardiopsis ansamitocini TaxID=1670832 RepID=UPI00255725C6|nr:hypothetical protein [Nocardiopsis ansamitocini]
MNWSAHQPPDPWGQQQQQPAAPRATGGLSPVALVLLAILLVAVLIIAVTVVVTRLNANGTQAAPAPAPEPVTASESEPAPAPDPSSTGSAAGPDVFQDGWQRAASAKWGFVYEIPPREDDWLFDGPTYIRGFEGDDGTVEIGMSGTSVYLDKVCAGWGSRGVIGAQGITDSDDTEEMSEGAALRWARYAYDDEGDPGLTVRSVEEFDSNDLSGHHAIVDVTVPGGGDGCIPPTAVVHTLAVPGAEDDTTRILVMILDTGVEDALAEETVDTVISTLRDVNYED